MATEVKLFFARLKLMRALRTLGGDPNATDKVFKISDILYSLNAFTETKRRLRSDPESWRVIQEERLLAPYRLEDLEKFPDNSLARAYLNHMKNRELDKDFYPLPKKKDEMAVFLHRMRQTHDLWHVIVGFDTDPAGEIGLQAFSLTHLSLPLSAVLVGGSLLNCILRQPDRLTDLVEHIYRGFQLGRQAQPLFPYDWQANWHRPLEEIRRELNLNLNQKGLS